MYLFEMKGTSKSWNCKHFVWSLADQGAGVGPSILMLPMLKNVAGKSWGPATGASPQTDQLLSPPNALHSMGFQRAQSPKAAWSLFLAVASIPKQRLSAFSSSRNFLLTWNTWHCSWLCIQNQQHYFRLQLYRAYFLTRFSSYSFNHYFEVTPCHDTGLTSGCSGRSFTRNYDWISPTQQNMHCLQTNEGCSVLGKADPWTLQRKWLSEI